MLDATSGGNPCQVNQRRRYQTVLQLAGGDPIVSDPLPRLGALGEHDQLSAVARDVCSIPVGVIARRESAEVVECPSDISWWVLTAHAFEVIRENPIPANPLPPLTLNEILAQGRPTSVLKGRAVLSDSTVRQTVVEIFAPAIVHDVQHPEKVEDAPGRVTPFEDRAGHRRNVEMRVLTNPNPTL